MKAAIDEGPSVEDRVVKLAEALKITTTAGPFGMNKVTTTKLLEDIEPFVLGFEAAEKARTEQEMASNAAVKAAECQLWEAKTAKADLEKSVADLTQALEEPENELRKRARDQQQA